MIVSLSARGRLYLVATILMTLLSVPLRVPPILLLSSLMVAYLVAYPLIANRIEDPQITFDVHLRHNVLFRGEVEILKLSIHNASDKPIPIIELNIKLPNSFFIIDYPNSFKFTINANSTININVPVMASSRGFFNLGPIDLKIVDPLQIFEETLAEVDDIYARVYPKRLGKQISQTRSKQIFSRLIGFFATSMKGMGTDFHGLREYIRGDPSKIVDWKATARLNKLISREYEDEQKLEIIIAIDSGATMRGSKFEYVLGMGMELYQGFVDENKPVGLVIFNDEIIQEYFPSSSPSRMNKIWASIYGISAKDVYSDYYTLDRWIDTNGITKSLIIVLGDLEGEFKEISDAVRNIKLRGNSVLFIDIWGYAFTMERAVEESSSEMSQHQYGEILKDVIGRGLKQSNVFRGLDVRQKMARYGTIYGYVADADDSIVDSLDRAMYSHFGDDWMSGNT